MSGAEIGAALAAIFAAVLGLILDRREKRKANEQIVKEHPTNPDGLGRFRQWVRDTKAKRDIQP